MVSFLLVLWSAAFLVCSIIPTSSADCLVDTALNDEFAGFIEAESIPLEGSCCQADVCGLSCPAEVPKPGVGKKPGRIHLGGVYNVLNKHHVITTYFSLFIHTVAAL